jgi:hypothetical protein
VTQTKLWATFYPGAANVKKALEIYDEMQARNRGHLAVLVADDVDRLLLLCEGDGRVDVVGHAVGFVAECARRLNLTKSWSAEWSRDCGGRVLSGVVALDHATQAFFLVHGAGMFSLAHQNLDDPTAQKQKLEFEVAMRSEACGSTEWLNENFGDDWRRYTKAVTVEDSELVEEQVYLFKTESAAVEFKLKFG